MNLFVSYVVSDNTIDKTITILFVTRSIPTMNRTPFGRCAAHWSPVWFLRASGSPTRRVRIHCVRYCPIRTVPAIVQRRFAIDDDYVGPFVVPTCCCHVHPNNVNALRSILLFVYVFYSFILIVRSRCVVEPLHCTDDQRPWPLPVSSWT